MMAYSITDLYHHAIRREVADWQTEGQIRPAQIPAIEAQFPCKLFTPRWTVRIGLAILGLFASSMSSTYLMMIFSMDDHPSLFLVVMALLQYLVLEWVVKARHYYRAGIDQALAAAVIVLLFLAYLFVEVELGIFQRLPLLGLAAVAAWLAYRFHAAWMALVAWGFFIFAVAASAYDHAIFSARVFPFFLCMLGVLTVFFSKKYLRADYSFQLWRDHATYLYIAGLVLAAACFNFQAVLGLSAFWYEDLEPATVSSLWIFRGLSLLIPLVYIVVAFFKRDIWLWRVGMLTLVAAAYALQPSSQMDISILMIIGGVILGGGAAWSLYQLKNPQRGFSIQAQPSAATAALFQTALAEGVATQAAQVPTVHTKLEGGSGGGAGSSGHY